MTTAELYPFKELLERREAELAEALRTRDGIAIERSPDQTDEIQYASQRDLAIQNLGSEFTLLRDVRAALRRIGQGSFGDCDRCGRMLSPKRLSALPWAARCIDCQEVADRDPFEENQTGGVALVNAA